MQNIMQYAGLDESQAEVKIARRNSNLRYADDTTLVAESEEELKSLWIREKEVSEETDLKLNIKKSKIVTSGLITSWQIRWGNSGNSGRLYFFEPQNHCRR